MAKKAAFNKSQAIVEYKSSNPDAKPKAIAEALQAKGHDINAGYVSTILSKSRKTGGAAPKGSRKKSAGGVSSVRAVQTKKGKRKSPTTRGTAATSGSEVSVATLLKVRDLVQSTGGVDAVQSALDAYKKLMTN